MSTFTSADEILEFAISNEREAHHFYLGLAAEAQQGDLATIFTELADQELGHETQLKAVKAGKKLLPVEPQVTDLKIADYTVEVSPSQAGDYQSALILAMNREKAAFRLYTDLANLCEDPVLRYTFLGLASQEAGHKLKLELEYDDFVLTDN